jgi:hypothetical protein
MTGLNRPNLETVIAALHDSEINGGVSWFYDGVWLATLGDLHNGTDAEAVLGGIEEAAEWLRATAIKLYPDSEFAQKYARGHQ